MSWPLLELGEVARAKSIWPILPDNEAVLQLTLDHIETNSGRLLSRDMKPVFKAGTSTIGFNECHVLYSKLRPYLNKVFLPDEIGIATSEMVPILPDEKNLDRNYLAHFLKTPAFVDWANQRSTGAKMPRTNMKLFWHHKIPLPPLAEQKRIAAILDKADAIRRKCEKAIALTDTLLKSVFLDMFGDTALQPDRWPIVPLNEFVKSDQDIRCGPFGTQLQKSEFMKQGVPLWGIKHVNRSFNFETDEFVSLEKFVDLQQYSLECDDVVMTRKGTIGNCALYPSQFPVGLMHSDLLRIRVDKGKMNPRFLADQLKFNRSFARQLSLISSGAIMAGINVGKLKNLLAISPPKEMQDKYVKFTRSLELQRSKILRSKYEANSLLASLTQRAFRGELTPPDLPTLTAAE